MLVLTRNEIFLSRGKGGQYWRLNPGTLLPLGYIPSLRNEIFILHVLYVNESGYRI